MSNDRPTIGDVVFAMNWLNLFNPRMWMSAGFTTVLALVPVGMVYEPAIKWLAVPIFLALMVLMCAIPAQCPFCRKRVKIGATRCSRCGSEVS